MITRRNILKSLFAGAGAIALGVDLDRELWEPGKRKIFIPPPKTLTLNVGDVFTIEGRYAVNPKTKKIAIYTDPKTGVRYKFLRRFTVTETVKNGEEIGSYERGKALPFQPLWPPIIESGQYINTVSEPVQGRRKICLR